MRTSKLAALGALALTAGLAGCSTTYNPPEEHVAVIPPPTVAPAAAAAQAQSPRLTVGMTPTGTPGVMQLQSFAGDVCLEDDKGNAAIQHCVCQQTDCNCQSTGTACTNP